MNEKQLRLKELDRLWLEYCRAIELDDPVRANQVVRDMILHCNRLLITVFDFMQAKTAAAANGWQSTSDKLKPANLAGNAALPVAELANELPVSTVKDSALPAAQQPTGDKYTCSECGRSFTSSHALRGHQRTHKYATAPTPTI